MKYTPLQTTQVTGAARMIPRGGVTGPVYLWGFTVSADTHSSEKILCLSDATCSTVTGTNIKSWAVIKGGTSRMTTFVNNVWAQPVRCVNGLRGKLVGGGLGGAGTTVIVHYGG